ncbi:HesA/MoeB/ThiF family protein [Pedobacter sp. HDW13]|uniref:HesA/MoeB/ThiF family protein n=1 Tax=Pedobacter sp. HDW13 TaxID=2714940 RepID=UPI00140A3359|nr:HesA/MoeB/ThiF family protein [Pedobacter sp. HDW13]QIL40406.1 HesA/MoeB/ThiF family protein [Pedobacter sp. HDW13]
MQRYQQQILVPEVLKGGQEKIFNARVLIIGAGGLGVPLATYLASAGVGHIGIIDQDTIAITNLHRQFLYTTEDLNKYKVDVLATRLKAMNPTAKITAYRENLDKNNAKAIIQGYDILCDCTDDTETRILIGQVSAAHNKPLVYAAVLEWTAYLTVLNHKRKIQLEDIFSSQMLRENANNTCSTSGIINTTCGIAGTMQALEVLKIILMVDSNLDGNLLCIETLSNTFKFFKIQKPSS